MKFIDQRADQTKPVSEALLRLKDLIIEKMRQDIYFENCFIMVCDYDKKLGYLEHLQMNFEPRLEDRWIKEISKPISIMLLENTSWKRYAWGVYLEGDCSCPKKCDCQNPPPDNWDRMSGVYHVSEMCPKHNDNPRTNPDCPVHE